MGKPSLDDYIDVAERILQFKEKHPDGSLQTIDWCVSEVAGKTFIVYRAAAYRTPDDPRPGHGTAWEPFPGPTSFTKDSELMNAETAAWGRAIVATGIAANRKIASAQEVKARAQLPLATTKDVAAMETAAGSMPGPEILRVLRECGLDGVTKFGDVPAEKTIQVTKALAKAAA